MTASARLMRRLRAPTMVAVGWACAALAGCGDHETGPVRPRVGDARQGSIWITRMGCGSCHQIPGVIHADGLVGPPLDHFARRTIVAGYLPNTPPNLIRWIQHPQEIAPGNAMPDGKLTLEQASDIAAYLYTLR